MMTLTTSAFSRWAAKQGIDDGQLLAAADDLEAGIADANPLGQHLWKFRVAKEGRGKSAGYRVFAVFVKDDRVIYLYGLQKTDRDNIPRGDLKHLKDFSEALAQLDTADLEMQIQRGGLRLLER